MANVVDRGRRDAESPCERIVSLAGRDRLPDFSNIGFGNLRQVMLGSTRKRAINDVLPIVLKASYPREILNAVIMMGAISMAAFSIFRWQALKSLKNSTMDITAASLAFDEDSEFEIVPSGGLRSQAENSPTWSWNRSPTESASYAAKVRCLISRQIRNVFPDFIFHPKACITMSWAMQG